jgi:hypothetical protein
MRNCFLAISLILLILTCACINEKTKTVTQLRYVCHDGSIVPKAKDCPSERQEKIREVTVERYVCWNGDTVNGSGECPILTTSTLAIASTTSTSSSTTSTIGPCQELGCDPGMSFVASKNSDKYHNCDCKWAEKINEDNLVCYASVKEAKDDDKEPCGVCKPPT